MTLFEFLFLLFSAIGLVMLGYHMHLEAKATKHVSNQLDTILDILDELEK